VWRQLTFNAGTVHPLCNTGSIGRVVRSRKPLPSRFAMASGQASPHDVDAKRSLRTRGHLAAAISVPKKTFIRFYGGNTLIT
jgi:hypothetical protein